MKVEINGQLFIRAPKLAEGKDLDAALSARFDSDAGDQMTFRDYIMKMVLTLWYEEEGFSGKRPFGNSGWKYEVWSGLAKAGFIDMGEYYEECCGYEDATREQCEVADKYTVQLIKRIFETR